MNSAKRKHLIASVAATTPSDFKGKRGPAFHHVDTGWWNYARPRQVPWAELATADTDPDVVAIWQMNRRVFAVRPT